MVFHLYVKEGCPACHRAIDWCRNNAFNAQVFEIGNDPIMHAGVNAHGGDLPILVSFLTNEYVVGFDAAKQKEYERLQRVLVERSSPGSFRMAGAEGGDSGDGTKVRVTAAGDAEVSDLSYLHRDVAGDTDMVPAAADNGVPSNVLRR